MRTTTSIFKAYDIRGKFPTELNERVAERIGYAAAHYLTQKSGKKRCTILVCGDVRISSPLLKIGLMKGILEYGSDILDGGIGTTPFFYFLMNKIRPDGGIMITASHSPSEYNGFKIQDKTLKAVSLGSGLNVIQHYFESKKLNPHTFPRRIESHEKNLKPPFIHTTRPWDILEGVGIKKNNIHGEISAIQDHSKEYLDFLARDFTIRNPIKIVVDTAGGAEAIFISRFLNRFPKITYKPLFSKVDGTFRTHSPNPLLPEAQGFVREELKRGGFRFGAVFDGDSDRIVFLDEKGKTIRADFIFALIGAEVLKEKIITVFAVTLNVSKGVREYIESRGGKIKLSMQGYPFLQKIMRRHKTFAGVELSGHYHFKKTFFRDSTLIPLIYLIRILSEKHEPLSKLIRDVQRYVTSEEIAFPTNDKQKVISRIKKTYKGRAKLSFMDGITVEFKDWWFNLRPSNTESVVRLSLEAQNQELFDEKLAEVEKLIKGN